MSWLSILGTAFSVLQSISQSRSEAYNAEVAKVEGKQAMVNAEADADRQRRLNAVQQSEAIATAGAQGTKLEGSPMLAFLENATQGELKAQDLLFQGQLRKSAKDVESDILKRQSQNTLGFGILGAGVKAATGAFDSSPGGGSPSSSSTVLTGSGSGYSTVGAGGVWSPSRYTLR